MAFCAQRVNVVGPLLNHLTVFVTGDDLVSAQTVNTATWRPGTLRLQRLDHPSRCSPSVADSAPLTRTAHLAHKNVRFEGSNPAIVMSVQGRGQPDASAVAVAQPLVWHMAVEWPLLEVQRSVAWPMMNDVCRRRMSLGCETWPAAVSL